MRFPPFVLVVAALLICSAHVGSPDAWFEGPAGPYQVLVHIEAPGVIPGIATVNVRVRDTGITRVSAVPNRFDATGGAPPPDIAQPVSGQPGWYRTKLWIMTSGSYSITVTVAGARGTGSAVIPLGAVALQRLRFDRTLSLILGSIGLVLLAGLLTIVRAAVRDGVLPPGMQPDATREQQARRAMVVATLIIAVVLFGGWQWWGAEDRMFVRSMFKPLGSTAALVEGAPDRIVLTINDSSWINRRDTTRVRVRGAGRRPAIVADHGKVMHMFVIDATGGAVFAHLHPTTSDTVSFTAVLPPLPSGRYSVFADIVHESGFTQTLVSTIELPVRADSVSGAFTDGDDAWAMRQATARGDSVTLQDGSVMTWLRSSKELIEDAPAELRFAVSAPSGNTAPLEYYMGMPGHAVVVRDDAKVFIHLHPLGTISVAAQMGFLQRADSTAHTPMVHTAPIVSDTISFPYAFPEAGNYHIWVQVKRGGQVLTGVFNVRVRDTGSGSELR
jgi:predicted secreted protein